MKPHEARDLFPITNQYTFLNHASNSPLSMRGRAALDRVLDRWTSEPGYFDWIWSTVGTVREAAGRLLGVDAETIAFVRSTTHGIALVAGGLDWQKGDNVVAVRGEFPSNVYPWMALHERGVEFRMAEVRDGRILPEAIFDVVDQRTRVVTLSYVGFSNGYRADLAAIGAECRRRGILLFVDAVQGIGVFRLDLSRMPVDFAVAGAHKWLLGGHGIGILYCRREVLPRVRPVLVGTRNMKAGSEERSDFFHYEFDFLESARRFEEAPVPLMGLVVLEAALGLLEEVGLDVIEPRVLALARRLAEGLSEKGYEVMQPWPRTVEESSGIVSVKKPGVSQAEILGNLSASRVVAKGFQGLDYVRFSPHFYNTEEEVEHVIDVLTSKSQVPATERPPLRAQ